MGEMKGAAIKSILSILLFLFVWPAWAAYESGSGTAEDPYEINDPCQMNSIGLHPEDWGSHFILTSDIDMGGFNGTQYNVIGNSTKRFTGSFDGKNHVISNFNYSTTETVKYIGLFGQVSIGGVIKDLGLEHVDMDLGTASSLGALAGFNYQGLITNCYVTGSVNTGANSMNIGSLIGLNNRATITNSWATCNVEVGPNSNSTGGLVGYNSSGNINECQSSGTVNSGNDTSANGGLVGYNVSGNISHCNATSDVASGTGSVNIGGLVGYNEEGNISYCQTSGSISGTDALGGQVGYNNEGSVNICSAAGDISGGTRIGGLIGRNDSGTIINCYATGRVNGVDAVGGLIGRNHKGNIMYCYVSGNINGTTNIGGFVGNEDRGTYKSCFWDNFVNIDLTGAGDVDPDPCDIIGITTSQMQTQSTFTNYGWDFMGEDENGEKEIWRMCLDGINYPRFTHEFLKGDIACPDGIEFNDLDYLSRYWLEEQCSAIPKCFIADVNRDGEINFQDYAYLAENWLIGF